LQGTSRGKAVLGVCGWKKLNITFDSQHNQIAMLAEQPFDFVCVSDQFVGFFA
jgi:hypothetical protein